MRYRYVKASFCFGCIIGTSIFLWQCNQASPASSRTIADDGHKPSVEQVAEAGAVFQKNCISCHQPPDLAFATDRAWLDQLNRTA